MTLQHVPYSPSPIAWAEGFSGPFEIFQPLANLLECTGAISHWAVVLADGQGIYVEEGHVKALSFQSIKSLEWFELPQAGYLGVPLYVDSNFIHDALPVIGALFPKKALEPLPNASSDLTDLVDHLPFLVSIIDRDFCYQFVNRRYEAVFHRSRQDTIGQRVVDVIGQGQFDKVEGALTKALAGEVVEAHFPAVHKTQHGSYAKHYIACSFMPKRVNGVVEGVYVCVRDQTPLKRITEALQKFHEITALSHLSLAQKAQKMLALGSEILNLPVAIVSHIEGQHYQVAYSHLQGGEPIDGTSFDLSECYCLHALERDQVTGFYHAGRSEIANHLCYIKHQFEAYIGVAIRLNGVVWGTLCFSGPDPRDEDFSEDEYELVKLFGQWLSSELAREDSKHAIVRAEQKYRLILESVKDGVVGVDNRGKISFVNSAALSLLGTTEKEVIGKAINRLLRSEFDTETAPSHGENLLLNAVRRSYKSSCTDAHFVRADGSLFPVQFTCSPVTDDVENGLSCVITFEDITVQKESENAQQQQMELFKSLFMDAPEAIVVVDDNRLIKMVNPVAEQMFGYQQSELIGRSPRIFYADAESFERVGLAYDRDHHPEREEYRMVYQRSDGREIVTDNVRSKMTDESGRISGFIVHCRDITSRLEIEADIAKAQSRLSIATESAGIGVWEMDLQTRELIWDQRMCELYELENASGRIDYALWASFIHPEDIPRLQKETVRAIEYSTDLDVDFRIVLSNGKVRYIKASARTALDTEGNPLYLFGTNMDVTERYETERILTHAREEAIRASQAKSNFLATMSHEIRTPLNGVLGMTEILSGSELSKEQQSQLAIIQNSGENLLELINEILDFSKIEAGHLSLEVIDFDLEGLVYDLSRLLVNKAEAKGIDLLVEYGISEFPLVRGDAYRIRQILMNLVGNAIKFTEHGQVLIAVTGELAEAEQELNVSLSVTDSGIGISEDAQSKLFQAFMQADNSTTRKFGGTGLGLAITKQLVDLMGGEISVTSQVGQGSVFTVRIPLGIAQPPQDHPLGEFNKVEFSKVLVVDDNATNLVILQNQLEFCQVEAEFYQDPKAAYREVIEAAKQNEPYDLLILDYLMPELDGLTFNKALHEQLAPHLLPASLMISSAGTLSSQMLKAAGIAKCIDKPASVHELKKGIDGLLGLNNPTVHKVSLAGDATHGPDREATEASVVLPASKILVVEDLKANLAVVKGLLSRYDVQLEMAENGLEAIEKWQHFKPDLILMDLHMPVMDGITAIKQIRHIEQRQSLTRVPILALTADVQPERVEEVKRAGGDGYISKPFKGGELLKTLSDCLPQSEPVATDGKDVMNSLAVEESNGLQGALDETVLSSLEEILGDQVQEIVLAFLQDADGVMVALDEALGNNDAAAIHRPAHSLKSVSANVGAMTLSQQAATLEAQAKSGEVVDASGQISAIKAEYVRVKDHLKGMGRLP
ncbi:Signal transduction histidine-protein kinase BarA [Marinomonas aquimarina]|uniref:Sensory/regulatory protein RpfC n=1 Tax=Marinomonas aquimarina TaxID=295068 RepID=A0A1A8TQ44_9GAMM|nr:PAS domain S-box protein [Marinomonas aquimarina]SBS35217.1 Signal transduction histidine-protein kinase BarA [Marinomonas aquimarina]